MVAPLLKVSAPHDTEDGCKYKRSFCCDVNRFCKKTVVTQQLMNRKLNLPHTPRISFCVTSTTVFGEEEVGCINEKAIRYTVFRMGCWSVAIADASCSKQEVLPKKIKIFRNPLKFCRSRLRVIVRVFFPRRAEKTQLLESVETKTFQLSAVWQSICCCNANVSVGQVTSLCKDDGFQSIGTFKKLWNRFHVALPEPSPESRQ